ncbi:MAG: hypothetical protein JRJ77_05825 [Deltaproteobacteria bacterium]|nr:hypothetical protein [Deltaproteobacteria bacterium]
MKLPYDRWCPLPILDWTGLRAKHSQTIGNRDDTLNVFLLMRVSLICVKLPIDLQLPHALEERIKAFDTVNLIGRATGHLPQATCVT